MGRRRVGIAAHPGVQSDVVMIAARGEENRLIAVVLGHLEPENVPVEAQGPVDIGHLQMNVTDVGGRVYDPFGSFARLHSLLLNLVLTPHDSTVAVRRRSRSGPRRA